MSVRILKASSWFLCLGLAVPVTAADEAPAVPSAQDQVELEDVTPSPEVEPGLAEYWQAVRLLWSRQPAEQAEGRRLLEASAELEFTHAQLLLGECYQSGSLGFKKNPKKGAAFFRLAAERGNAFAAVSYGVCLYSGVGMRKDPDKAFEWMSAAVAADADYTRPQRPADDVPAADATDETKDTGAEIAGTVFKDPVAEAQARAHLILGVLLEKRKQLADAQAHYVAAATAGPAGRSGIYAAAIQAAVNYAFGHGVPRDLAKANDMLEQSRKLVRRAGISLVHNFADQKLIDDFAVSELEEEVAAASEDTGAELQFEIARTFGDRKSKDYNPQEAVKWFELAAESNKPWAMLELAFLYTRGDLGAPDPAKAFTWFEKAGAKDGGNHGLGVANTAICLLHGIGVGSPGTELEFAL